jgi:nicotinic acid mononucleotide adenylyltransferase
MSQGLNTFFKTNVHREKIKNVCFFSGSFNPWHQGHQSCVDLFWLKIQEQTQTDCFTLLILPDLNPWKQKNFNLPQDHQQEILEQIPDQQSNTHVYDGFLDLGKANPTYCWINEFQNDFPELKLHLLLGFDSFKTIHQWYEAPKLLKKLSGLFVASRLETSDQLPLERKPTMLKYPNLEVSVLGNHPFEKLSSTKIRDMSK